MWVRVSGCQIDISHVAIIKRVTKQTIFLTYCLEILENEVIVDVNHSFRKFQASCRIGTITLFSLDAILCLSTVLIKLGKLVILLGYLKYSLRGQKINLE